MKAQRDPKTGKWFIQYRFTDWQGNRRKSTKRGFDTKREAEAWLAKFLQKSKADFDMPFGEFVKLYLEDMGNRLRATTLDNKRYIINDKVLPYFGKKRVNDISASDIRRWQGELMKKGYSETYLKTINNQLNAIFNYAVQYYDLGTNPCRKAGSMGKNKADEMDFWTIEEYQEFIDHMIDNRPAYMAFQVLFWTGMRKGELLALTREDFDLERRQVDISKSYARLNKKDLINAPKTPKSRRKISLPEFLVKDLREYFDSIFGLEPGDRVFPFTSGSLNSLLKRGCEESGVKKIRVHDLRHSHAAMLANMNVMPLEVAERLGHENVETTLNIYEHLYPDSQDRLAAKINELYKEGTDE